MNAPTLTEKSTISQGHPGRCRGGCHAEILFVQRGPRKDGQPGGKMPVDAAWHYGDGHRDRVVLDDQGHGSSW